MDYAAALRASPSGPAVRLDTTPVAKATAQKAPVSKPVKVEVEEPIHVVEEETVASVPVVSAPAKPPTNTGLSPVVRFVITVPSSAPNSKDSSPAQADTNAEGSDSSSETEEDTAADSAANGANARKHEAKAHNYSVHDLENNFARLSDLVSLLEKNAEDRSWELAGGFRFSKGSKAGSKAPSGALHDLDLPTVTLSLKWLSALIEFLRSKTSTTIAVGGGAFVSIVRVEGQVRVIRINNNGSGSSGKEVWMQFDDTVLEVREQAKLYLAVANRIEQVLERRESQLADKLRKDAAQKRRLISNKLQTAAFTSMLDTLHGLLAGGSTEFPTLSRRFHEQEAHLAAQRRRVKDENADMSNIFFSVLPANLFEANLKDIVAKLEPVESEKATGAEGDAAAAAGEEKASEQPKKKLSKKEEAAAAHSAAVAETERRKQAEADAEVSRKEAEKVRREKQEKLMAQQAEQKRKQLVANPFAHLEGFSETAAAALEADAEVAKEKHIKKMQQAQAKQDAKAVEDAKRAAKENAEANAARSVKTSAAAQESIGRQAAEDSKRISNKEAEDKKRQAAKDAADQKRQAAERQAAEQAAAAKKKQEKAERVAAEKQAAAERKKSSSPSSSSVASPESSSGNKKGSSVAGPDRSEKQRKAEKIEHEKKEKQRAKEMRQIAVSKKSDNTILYATLGGGAIIALILAYFIYSQLNPSALSR